MVRATGLVVILVAIYTPEYIIITTADYQNLGDVAIGVVIVFAAIYNG